MRVLIATATAGGGHLAAAAALEEAWRASRPDDVVDMVDVVTFFSPLHRKIHADGYLALVEHAPELWGLMFNKTDNPELTRRLHRLQRIFPSNSRVRFARYVQEFAPDVLICTHYVPLETLGRLRAKQLKKSRAMARKGMGMAAGAYDGEIKCGRQSAEDKGESAGASGLRAGLGPLVVCVPTDFEAHALWMNSCVDLYCVAAEETRARLVARGAAPANVVATGIPISAKFSARPSPKAVRQTLGLRDDQPVLLVLSGGFGTGPVGQILAELNNVERPLQVVVVAGRNEALRRELAAGVWKHPTHVLGFATNMHELMAVAALIITKPGGLTTSEVLAMGKPVLVVNPIPGQEAANSDFLLEHGAAAKVNRHEDLPYRLEQLLGSKKLAEMARAAKGLGRPEAASDICAEVLRRLGEVPE